MVAQINSAYIRTRPSRLWARLLSYGLFEGRPLTTRGRWINPVLFALFGLEKRLPQMKAVKVPVFILGTGRSGTTILGIVLSMHRDAGFLNEPKALWHAVYKGEDLIGSYSRAAAHYRLGAADVSNKTRRDAHRIYGAYLRVSFTTHVVDKYPEMIFRAPFLKAIFPDARFLFLSRNGWDTCGSIKDWSGRHGDTPYGETHDWWGVNRRKWELLLNQIIPEHADLAPHIEALKELQDHRIMAAVEWIVTMREGLALMQAYPGDTLHIPYETLCKSPRDMAGKIADYAGLRTDETYLSYAESVLSMRDPRPPFLLPDFLETPFHATHQALAAKET